jgi:hypothetical protein
VRSGPSSRPLAVAAALDVGAVALFVAIGREEHDDGTPATPYFEVAAPFLIALLVGWVVLRAWRQPASLRTGVGVWMITVALGMIVRRTVFDDGTALAFVIVATLFLGVTIVGWRLLATRIESGANPSASR